MDNLDQHSTTTTKTKEALDKGALFAKSVCELEQSVSQDIEKHIDEYMNVLVKKVKENPIQSILIAGGVGFLLSALRKK